MLAEVTAAWRALPAPVRGRVHLASLPMDDAEENARDGQRDPAPAAVVVQKSLAEGFGLTVAEAMWKGAAGRRRPASAASRTRSIDEVTGLLVDPRDLAAFGRAVCRLLADDELARRLGSAARERVRERFLEPRHLRQWVDLIERLPARTAATA